MAVSAYKRGINYSATYLLLIKDYVAFLGPKAIFVIGGVVLAGLLYPIPFAIMGLAIYGMMAGHDSQIIKILSWRIELGVDSAFLFALIFAGATLSFKYITNRVSLDSTSAWQTSLYWRAVNQLPHIARWDLDIAVPMTMAMGRIGNFLNAIVRSGFLIGRVVAIGLSNVIIVMGGLVVLSYLDPISVAVLVVIAVLCLPIYAWASLQMVGKKQQDIRKQRDEKTLLQKILEEVVLGARRQVDTRKMSVDDLRRFEVGYTTMNEQLKSINLISFIAGAHVVVSITIIYLINGASLAEFIRDKVIFFVVLIFVMRAALTLATLMARFSRNYSSLATLRAYLHPRRKRLDPLPNAPENAVFSLKSDDHNKRYPVCVGAPVFVVMPYAAHAHELVPLSNALEILKEPSKSLTRYITFVDNCEPVTTADRDGEKTPTPVVEIAHQKTGLKLPVLDAVGNAKELGPVAVTSEIWEALSNDGQANEYCHERIVFVVISQPSRPEVASPKSLLVVSDGRDILAVGPFAETWQAKASEAFENASSKKGTSDIDDFEEI